MRSCPAALKQQTWHKTCSPAQTWLLMCPNGLQMEEASQEEGPQAKQAKHDQAPEQANDGQQQAAGEGSASGPATAASSMGAPGESLSDMPALSQRM